MTATKDDYRELVIKKQGEKQEQKISNTRANIETFARQAPKITALTNDENWDLFLSFVQACQDNAKEAREHYQKTLLDPILVDPLEISRAKLSYHICNERFNTLQHVMDLPKDLLTAGKVAKDLMGRLPKLDIGSDKDKPTS